MIIWERETVKRRQLFDLDVPGHGWITFRGDDAEVYVDALRYNHRPTRFQLLRRRHCKFCGQAWPCYSWEWAWEIHHSLE